MTWHVWTDGSCQHGVAEPPRGGMGWGGWAAIVEHGSADDSAVLTGRVPGTTNVRMELEAAVQGLGYVAGHRARAERMVLHTDSTAIVVVRDWLLAGRIGTYAGRDRLWWLRLADGLARTAATVDLLPRGQQGRGPLHKRAHVLAGAEARGGMRNLPANAVPLEDGWRIRKGMRRVTARSWAHDVLGA